MAANTTVYYTNFGDGSTTGYYAVTPWATGTAKTVGQLVRQNAAPSVGNERVFVCVVAGTTHATTEPTWVVTQGSKTTDNTVTWCEITGKPAVNGDVTNTPASSSWRSGSAAVGNLIKNNGATHYFVCTTAGTCGAGEPSYNTTTGATTADSTATWTCIGAVGSFTAWMAPGARIQTSWGLSAAATFETTIYVSSIHAETQAAALSLFMSTTAFSKVLCVANGGSIPPTAADLTTGASVTTTGNNALTVGANGGIYVSGIAFNCGTSGAPLFNIGTNGTFACAVSLMNCALNLRGSGQQIVFGNAIGSKIELVNTTIGFSGGNDSLSFKGSLFLWRDTPSALSAVGGTWPNTPFSGATTGGGSVLIENVDLSAISSASNYFSVSGGPLKAVLSRCKLSARPISAAANSPGHVEVDLIDCDTAGATYRHERYQQYEGTQTVETTAIKTGGASDGTTGYSWKIVSTVSTSWYQPFESLPIAIWNPTTGADVVVTLEGITNATALPNNDDIWLNGVYFGTSASTLGSRVTQTKATPLTANAVLPASTVAWDSIASARQNSHAYSLGDLIKLASNTGRLFICTTAGTTAASEPGGYASAVDGGNVTDSGAVFRAMMRFKLTVTLTGPQPQSVGYIYARIRVGKASATYYVDPKITLT